ncbi:MAG TPA: SUMF1/EgtB/PvdO family nonheme iron enzyme [Planctomycetota bacterium]|jgi:formylglycine-generating enzyme required for sulfatase activity|nr:SUMF1/EgtB/PvdO family nonheme iron enzyme [Planctomycetota bacterium]HJM39302.1 SUMF1/EgtB/PvdO family nonheme iron enzyme [Planctomycetota bacterium]|tara:strand:+ start:51212 stop:52372 length:1161 start_codon:yes stop_codon:yes gene_type:complete
MMSVAFLAIVMPSLLVAQDPRMERKLARAEKRFSDALATRDRCYNDLLTEYSACKRWLSEETELGKAPPRPLKEWLVASAVPEPQYVDEQTRILREREFHLFWNTELYKRSRTARAFSVAAKKLERSFHAIEKLRHPERYQKGFETTPTGMALIAAGKYTLPPSEGYLLGYPKFQKEREIKVSAFYLDKYEVTCSEFSRFLLAQPLALREEHLPSTWRWSSDGSPLFPDGHAAHSVTGVSWSTASQYAEWVGKRLPTENEWQIAASGFSQRRYPLGDLFDASKINCQAHGAGQVLPSRQFPEDSTPQGILCMTGNVREWVSDLYEEPINSDRAKSVRDAGPESMAVLKGGSWRDDPAKSQAHYRWLFPATDTRLSYVGFRCAMDIR